MAAARDFSLDGEAAGTPRAADGLRRASQFSQRRIPTGFHHSAQGCDDVATLGWR